MSASSYTAEPFGPRCDKCGAEITTGLMAAFCPKGKECEFYVPGVEEFAAAFAGTPATDSGDVR